jgi:hypothetical protein
MVISIQEERQYNPYVDNNLWANKNIKVVNRSRSSVFWEYALNRENVSKLSDRMLLSNFIYYITIHI